MPSVLMYYLSSIVNEGNYSVKWEKKVSFSGQWAVGSGQWAMVVAVLLRMEQGSMTPMCLL